MENAIVSRSCLRKRPGMPPMKATGRKTAMRDSVVAMTARPISLVPRDGGHVERRLALLLDVPEDVLEHDDRVVDHDPDGQREREERDRR